MTSPITTEVRDGILIVTSNNPPVNALGAAVRQGLAAAIDQLEGDPEIKAAVIRCEGRTFFAGADITEFGKPPVEPMLPAVIDRIEASSKPIVAAIHGTALGGGLEVTLGCHYRVAVPSAKLGVPEVKLGLLPGAGGTQRLPRVAGIEMAAEMCATGNPISASKAAEVGLVDKIAGEESLLEDAVALAKAMVGTEPRRSREMPVHGDPAFIQKFATENAKKFRGFDAPMANLRCIQAAVELPFDEGIAFERQEFMRLMFGTQSAAQRHIFFAERQAAKIDGIPEDTQLRPINKVGVIGAGTMGGGIAMSLADFGFPVKLVDASPEGLERGLQRIRDNYAVSVKRGSITQAQMDERLPRIQPVEKMEDIADCDAVIEAVFEQLPVKQEIFARLDAVMKPEAILLTNTSAIDIDKIAGATKRPEMVAGAHFFAPANVMKLLEVVEGSRTSPVVLAAAMKLGREIGKISAYAGNCDGFVANRSRIYFTMEQNLMVEEGALPEQIDRVMVEFGYPMGPFAVNDMSGLDVSYFTRRRRKAEDPNYRMLPIPDRLVESGRKGQKTGAGWYRYEKGDRTPHVDPEVHRIIKEVAAEHGIEQRAFSDQEVLHRLLFAGLNEACKILEEGKALRASDIDVMWLNGFGFPRYRGGLMFWADSIGARDIYNQIAAWHQRYGDRWRPSNLLREVAERGGSLREIKSSRMGQ